MGFYTNARHLTIAAFGSLLWGGIACGTAGDKSGDSGGSSNGSAGSSDSSGSSGSSGSNGGKGTCSWFQLTKYCDAEKVSNCGQPSGVACNPPYHCPLDASCKDGKTCECNVGYQPFACETGGPGWAGTTGGCVASKVQDRFTVGHSESCSQPLESVEGECHCDLPGFPYFEDRPVTCSQKTTCDVVCGSGGSGAGGSAGSGTGGSAGSGTGGSSGSPPTCSSVAVKKYCGGDKIPNCGMPLGVACGTGKCMVNAKCVDNGTACECNTGYLPVDCATGAPYSGSAVDVGCLATSTAWMPQCDDQLEQVEATCKCSDGSSRTTTCSQKTTCDKLCATTGAGGSGGSTGGGGGAGSGGAGGGGMDCPLDGIWGATGPLTGNPGGNTYENMQMFPGGTSKSFYLDYNPAYSSSFCTQPIGVYNQGFSSGTWTASSVKGNAIVAGAEVTLRSINADGKPNAFQAYLKCLGGELVRYKVVNMETNTTLPPENEGFASLYKHLKCVKTLPTAICGFPTTAFLDCGP